jgi:hypothetical protein
VRNVLGIQDGSDEMALIVEKSLLDVVKV